MLQEHLIPIGDHQLNLVRGPSHGREFLFLHGVTRRWQSFLPLIPSLLHRWSIMGWDARGHGLSDRASRYLVVDYVTDACELVTTQFSQPGVIYGHSLGAMVALAVAAQHPELVHAIILEDPPFETMGRKIEQSALLSFFAGMKPFASHRRPLETVARDLSAVTIVNPITSQSTTLGQTRDASAIRFSAASLRDLDPEVLTPIVSGKWLDGFVTDDLLVKVRCPVLLLQADSSRGGMLTDHDAERLPQVLPDCTLVRFKNAPHLIHWAQSNEVYNCVAGFLESV